MKEIEAKREVSPLEKSRLAPSSGNSCVFSPDPVSPNFVGVPTFYGRSLSFPTSLEATRHTLLVGCLALYGSLSFPTSLKATRHTLLVGCLALYGSLDI
ncbi:hypothetical protein M9Y82_02250 [Leptospira weilii]|uniref:hypothetical protein n=1 Tax=Leptospira weilii TaxID=28184 RepID=UPI0020235280|nr:hypothetical protein [Leptospira weilii]MCL8265492.1 hypothetical protein [Leptospira weilii]